MAAAGAAIAALAAATAAPAAAGTPVGTVVATDVPRPPAVDHETGRLVYDAAPGIVRVVDTVTSASRDIDVSAGCEPSQEFGSVRAAADGAVLLWCAGEQTWRGSNGEEQRFRVILNRILDGADWSLKEPVRSSIVGGGGAGLVREGIIFRYQEREGTWEQVLDWRTGRLLAWGGPPCDRWRASFRDRRDRRTIWSLTRCDGSARTVLPHGPDTVAHGFASWSDRGLDNVKTLTAYLPQCRLLARWQVGAIDVVEHLPGEALLIGAADRGGGPLTETRVSLAGLCDRIAAGWGLRASAGGRTVTARLNGGTVADAATGADTSPLPLATAPQPRVRAGTTVRLRTTVPARSVRWRVAGGRWRAARGAGRAWTATLPARVRGSHVLELTTRPAGGGELRHTVRLTLTGARR